MAKPVVSFKPTPECGVQLAELIERWGCDRTAAIIRAIEIASGEVVPVLNRPDNVRVEKVEFSGEQTKITPVVMKPSEMSGSITRSEAIPKPSWKTGETVERKSGSTLTGRPHGSVPKGKK